MIFCDDECAIVLSSYFFLSSTITAATMTIRKDINTRSSSGSGGRADFFTYLDNDVLPIVALSKRD